MSGYTDFTIERFGGLNLAADPEEVGAGGAVDLLNVRFDREGRVRSRDGTATFCTATSGTKVYALSEFVTSAGATQVIVGTSAAFEVFNSSGVSLGNQPIASGSTAGPIVRVGTPSNTYAYVNLFGGTMYRWDGSAWSASTASAPTSMGVTPWDNRLVLGVNSRLLFSDPGAPETFGASNYVDVNPGDGDQIEAIVPWREFLFVFKTRRFYVFYGTSLASDGVTPVFNYRTVDTGGIGLAAYNNTVVAGRDAVYFAGGAGIYRTTGGIPELISGELTPLFLGGPVPFFTYGALPKGGSSVTGMAAVNDALAVMADDGSNRFMLWWEQGQWSVFSLGALVATGPFTCAKARLTSGSSVEDLLFPVGTAGVVRRMNRSYTDDAGTAITSRYRTGFYDLGIDEEKTIRETTLNGQGTVAVSMSRDFGSLGTATNVTLGTAPATARKHVRVAQHGDLFSTQLASVSGGAWAVNRLTHHVREQRRPGAKTT